MTYVSPWEWLSDSRKRVMAKLGCSQLEAETAICQALADGAIDFRAKLKKHETSPMRCRDRVLERTCFQIPTTIDRDELDWDRSSPQKPWVVKRGHFQPPGYWELEWIQLSKADVARALCTARDDGASAQRSELVAADTKPVAHDSKETPPAKGTWRSAGSARRHRGPRPKKLEQVKEAMRNEIRQRKISVAELGNMLEKNLATNYGVSRDTARKARMAVLQEFGEE